MQQLINQLKRIGLLAAAVLMISGAPAGIVLADGCAPPSGNGVSGPVGTDASTYTYHCDGQYAGKWTNQYYVYDPTDGSQTALYDQAYQYDCDAKQWTALWWSYSPAQGSFYQSRIPTDAPSGRATNCPTAPATTGGGAGNSGSGNSQQAQVGTTGTGSDNSVNNNTNVNSTVLNNNTVYLRNGVVSQATSGNASVMGNTVGGSALSGDSTSISSIANFLQSNSGVFGPDLANFVANIDGDVNGDFMFDPAATLGTTGTDSTNSANNNLKINSNNTNNNSAAIVNNIDVNANSGDAKVADNTTGGNATSGNAKAIVNLMNFINSSISAGKSFVGTINVNGNLNGDILLPPGLVNQLLASTGSGSTNTANNNTNLNGSSTNNNTTDIANNLNSDAQSGNADVNNNTVGGTAKTGKANTNVTLLNLTGSHVVGSNDILVFVNVLGHWVGMIMNAPAGSTAASLGGGITQTGTNSDNSTNNNLDVNATDNNTNTTGITNNVNAHAKSGKATVSGNTVGGDATSGDADTAINIANLTNSQIGLTNWFGILFINVFGNWTGSFGVNTSAGDPVTSGSTGAGNSQSAGAPFQFVPASAVPGASNRDANTGASSGNGSTNGSNNDGVVLASKTIKNLPKTTATTTPTTSKSASNLLIPIIGAAFAFLILFAGERRSIFKKK